MMLIIYLPHSLLLLIFFDYFMSLKDLNQSYSTQQQTQFNHPIINHTLQTKQIQFQHYTPPTSPMNESLQQNPQIHHQQNSHSSPLKVISFKNSTTHMQQSESVHATDSNSKNNHLDGSHNIMHHSLQHHSTHGQNDQANPKKNTPKSPTELFQQARKILKKSPEIRTPNDNQLLYQLTEHSEFLSQLVQNVSLQCFKGIMKQAKIQQVRERQLLCEQGKPITHIVVLLDGKLGVCKQQDDFAMQMQQTQPQPQGQKTPTLSKSNHSQFPYAKQASKQKQTKTIQTIVQMDNIYDQLTALSCKEIDTIRKKNAQLKRKSSIPLTAGLFLPMPFTKEQFEEYEIQSYLNPGEEYGAKARCKSKIHPNTCFAVEKSTLLIIEFNLIIYWFEHSFRAKLGETIQKLKKIPAFSFLQDGKLAQCILHMKKQKRKRNDHIYRQGAPSQKLYILLHGQIKLSKQAKLFEQNPNELYVNRKKLMQKSTDPLKKQDESKRIDALPYANLTTLYNFRPMKKVIEIGIITSGNDCFSLMGEQELIEKRPRQTSATVTSFDCEYYEIQVRKLEELLGSKFIEQFYQNLAKSLKKVILYHQNEYAEKVNLENRHNLDYFYYEDNKSKESPRKYKLEKINNKFNDTKPTQMFTKTLQQNAKTPLPFENDTIKPYYTTFNFHKLVKTQRLTHTRKMSERQAKQNSARKRNDSEDSHDNIKMKFDPVEEKMIDISHTWKPIKKKVIQEIKVMQKISPKRHFIDINEPLIEQKYFRDLEKEQKRIDKEHRVFVLSLGKRTKW